MLDVSKYDRIVLGSIEFNEVIDWWNQNGSDTFVDTLPFDEGAIVLKDFANRVNSLVDRRLLQNNGSYIHWFKRLPRGAGSFLHSLYSGNELVLEFITKLKPHGNLQIIENEGISHSTMELKQSEIRLNTNLFFAVMKYIAEYEKERVHVKKIKVKRHISGKKSRSRKIITLRKKIFIYDKRGEKRKFKRITDTWGVRGHWRNYKTGKRVWVTPYVKGKGEKEAKEYRI